MQVLVLSDDEFRQAGCASIISNIFDQCEVLAIKRPQQLWENLLKTDLILFDIRVSSREPWEEILTTINEKRPDIPLCLIANSKSNDFVRKAFDKGANGYLHTGAPSCEVEETIRGVTAGKTILPDIIWKPQEKTTHSQLTAKQIEIITHMARGDSNKMIADSLVITVATVKRHISNIFMALGAKNRVEAVNIFNNTSRSSP